MLFSPHGDPLIYILSAGVQHGVNFLDCSKLHINCTKPGNTGGCCCCVQINWNNIIWPSVYNCILQKQHRCWRANMKNGRSCHFHIRYINCLSNWYSFFTHFYYFCDGVQSGSIVTGSKMQSSNVETTVQQIQAYSNQVYFLSRQFCSTLAMASCTLM